MNDDELHCHMIDTIVEKNVYAMDLDQLRDIAFDAEYRALEDLHFDEIKAVYDDADNIEEDPRWDTRDDLAAQIETLRQTARVWDPALMALAGVVLSISYDGELTTVSGVVRAADEKAVREIRKARQQEHAHAPLGSGQLTAAAQALNGLRIAPLLIIALACEGVGERGGLKGEQLVKALAQQEP